MLRKLNLLHHGAKIITMKNLKRRLMLVKLRKAVQNQTNPMISKVLDQKGYRDMKSQMVIANLIVKRKARKKMKVMKVNLKSLLGNQNLKLRRNKKMILLTL